MNDTKILLRKLKRLMDDPENSLRYQEAGVLLLKMGDKKNAELYLHKAYELSPSDPQILRNYAQALYARSKWKESAEIWKQYGEREPEDQTALEQIRDCCYQMGKYQSAAEWTKRLNRMGKAALDDAY